MCVCVCVCVSLSLCVHVCKLEWSVCILPRGDTQGYWAYVLRVIDLLEETNTIAVDKSQQHPTE